MQNMQTMGESRWMVNMGEYVLIIIILHYKGFNCCYHPWSYHKTLIIILADVDISPNPNPFNFCTTESEYIKKTGIRIHFFQNWRNPWIHLWPRIRIHFIFCHRIRIQLPLERYGPQPIVRTTGQDDKDPVIASQIKTSNLINPCPFLYGGEPGHRSWYLSASSSGNVRKSTFVSILTPTIWSMVTTIPRTIGCTPDGIPLW